jgi:hypothetical protein
VQHTTHAVAILGSGPSLIGFDLAQLRGLDVIAVNRSILHLPHSPRFWFTMDTSDSNRDIMAKAGHGPTTYYAAVYPHYGQRPGKDPPEPGVHYLKRIHGTGPKVSRDGLSTDPTGIHTGNSAYGALGLAFLMGARRIALLGVDGTKGYAWSGRGPGDLSHLKWLFSTAVDQLAAAGVKVVVGSPESTVDCWPRMTPGEAVEWLQHGYVLRSA